MKASVDADSVKLYDLGDEDDTDGWELESRKETEEYGTYTPFGSPLSSPATSRESTPEVKEG